MKKILAILIVLAATGCEADKAIVISIEGSKACMIACYEGRFPDYHYIASSKRCFCKTHNYVKEIK